MTGIYAVTGATGFLGREVCAQLLAEGADVRALVLPGDEQAAHLPEGIHKVEGNVVDGSGLDALLGHEPEQTLYVINCAGIISLGMGWDERVFQVNVVGTENVVEAAIRHHAKKLVHVASVHAMQEEPHGHCIVEPKELEPASLVGCYAKTKAMAVNRALELAKQGDLDVSIIYPSGIVGPGGYRGVNLFQVIRDLWYKKLPAGVHGAYAFVDVRDVAQAIIAAAQKGKSGQGYLLGGHVVTIRDILTDFHKLTGKPLVKTILPLWVAKLALPFLWLFNRIRGKQATFTRLSLHILQTNSDFDSTKAESELGFTSRPFKETLKDTIDWMKQEGILV